MKLISNFEIKLSLDPHTAYCDARHFDLFADALRVVPEKVKSKIRFRTITLQMEKVHVKYDFSSI